jgi:hypothetical protein
VDQAAIVIQWPQVALVHGDTISDRKASGAGRTNISSLPILELAPVRPNAGRAFSFEAPFPQMETVVRKAQHFIDTHISNGNRRWLPTLRSGKEDRFQADFKLITSTPATPAGPASTPRGPDLTEATPATPADPSSIPLAPDAADFANAPATPADPSSPASDPVDVMRKVLATWADASSMPRAPDLPEPSTPAPSASKAE